MSDFFSRMNGAVMRKRRPPKAARVPALIARAMARTNAGRVSG